ncbi:hypothetical protein JW935_24065 [candidate division KSB1 bacterium]|nr:hypothetical protein [candidate division KSB1 bacterium]
MRQNGNLLIFFALLFGISLMCSCSSVMHNNLTVEERKQQVERDKKNLPKLVHNVLGDIRDQRSIRELGLICLRFEKYKKARLFLKRASSLDKTDNKAKFYYGLALEMNDQTDEALDVYRAYDSVSSFSPYHRAMRGRYDWLTRRRIEEEMRNLMQQEEKIGLDSLDMDAIAIFPLVYQGDNSEYEPLGKGLSEMIITDLSQVTDLQIVERVRLNTLFEEMSLGQTGLIDGNTAPRYGKLLRANRIISGVYDVLEGEKLTMEVEYWDFPNREPSAEQSKEDKLTELLKLQKELVLDLVTDMGIYLTREEKDRILRIPTKNLQAFMAFCLGVESQDNGDFSQAAEHFQKAVDLDPYFDLAAQHMDENMAMGAMGVDKNQLVANLNRIEQPINQPLSPGQMTRNRLQMTLYNIGSFFVPGQDNREAPEEAVSAGMSSGFGDLPDPPGTPGAR